VLLLDLLPDDGLVRGRSEPAEKADVSEGAEGNMEMASEVILGSSGQQQLVLFRREWARTLRLLEGIHVS
jgi:hypothetical protein